MFVEDDPFVVDSTTDNESGLDGEGNGNGTGAGCVGVWIMSTRIRKWSTNAARRRAQWRQMGWIRSLTHKNALSSCAYATQHYRFRLRC